MTESTPQGRARCELSPSPSVPALRSSRARCFSAAKMNVRSSCCTALRAGFLFDHQGCCVVGESYARPARCGLGQLFVARRSNVRSSDRIGGGPLSALALGQIRSWDWCWPPLYSISAECLCLYRAERRDRSAPTEAVRQPGWFCPADWRTRIWLGSERSPRQVEVLQGQRMSVAEAVRWIGVTQPDVLPAAPAGRRHEPGSAEAPEGA